MEKVVLPLSLIHIFHAGQIQVQDQQVEGLAQKQVIGFRAVIAPFHRVFFKFQILRNAVAQQLFVLDHQNAHHQPSST